MDRVPLDFCERVSARWRCCFQYDDCGCGTLKVTEKWSFPEKIRVNFIFGVVDGRVKYAFSDPDYIRRWKLLTEFQNTPICHCMLAMEGLMKHRNFKKMQIDSIILTNKMSDGFRDTAMTFLDVELRTLLKFVSYLSNDPELKIGTLRDLLHTPEGIIIKNWVEERSFSRVRIASYTTADQRLLECQFQRANPSYIHVEDVSGGKHYLVASLKWGQLRMFACDKLVFPFEVLERIIANYQRKPEDYTPGNYKIWVKFDKTTDKRLAEMAEKGLCEVEGYTYRFRSNTARTIFRLQYQVYEEVYSLWVDDE